MSNLSHILKNQFPFNSTEKVRMVNFLKEDPIISNEGFFSNIKEFFRKKSKAKLDLGNLKKSIAGIRATYANPAWLEKRKLATGEVNVKGGGCFEGDPLTFTKKVMAEVRRAEQKNQQFMHSLISKVKPAVDHCDQYRLADVEQIQSLTDAVNEVYESLDIKAFETVTIRLKTGDRKLPALDAEEVVNVAKLAIQVLEQMQEMVQVDPRWAATFYVKGDKGYRSKYADESAFQIKLDTFLDGPQRPGALALDKLAGRLHAFEVEADMMYWSKLHENRQFLITVVKALANWIDASVK